MTAELLLDDMLRSHISILTKVIIADSRAPGGHSLQNLFVVLTLYMLCDFDSVAFKFFKDLLTLIFILSKKNLVFNC